MRKIRVLVTVLVDDFDLINKANLPAMQTAAVEAVNFSLKDVVVGFVESPTAEYIPVSVANVVLYDNDWDN